MLLTGNPFSTNAFPPTFDRVMTIHRLHAGEGYLYLTRQVASGDRLRDRTRDLTRYYTDTGTPPGMWMGRGATELGVSGMVSEAQMQALFGEGLHPNADTTIATEIAAGRTAQQAIAAAKLGASFAQFTTKQSPITENLDQLIDEFTLRHRRRPTWDERTVLRSDAARNHLTETLGHAPLRAEIDAALAEEKEASRKAVAGFDCVFTPPKSISLLWGLADDDLRAKVWQCHRDAVREVLEWMESRVAVTRRGHNGVRQIDAEGLVVAAFEHFDNRAGDPNLHTHAVISTKVLGSDGKWSALDARPLFAAGVSFSSRYNAIIVAKIRRLGFRFEERHRGRGKQPVLEVVGIGDDMITEFSRTPDIIARTEQLVAQYRATHGHTPSTTTQYKLAQQATLETRNAKPVPTTLRHIVTEWNQRAQAFLGPDRDGARFVADLLHEHNHPETSRAFRAEDVAVAVGADLGGSSALATTDRDTLDASITRHLDAYPFATPRHRSRAHTAVHRLLTRSLSAELQYRIDALRATRQRTRFAPQDISREVVETVARRRATWTESNIRSAVEDRVAVCEFPTDAAHRAAVEEVTALVRDRLSLQLTVDPEPVPPSLARRNGDSVFTVTGATRHTSHAVLDAENRLLHAADTPTPHAIPTHLVDDAITALEHDRGLRLHDDQRAIAHYLCTHPSLLAVAIGPAGAGKTTAMRAVADAWRAAGRDVIALAPSAAAARELGAALDVSAKTIAKLLTQAEHDLPTGLSPGAMILIDEASMAATADLDATLALARAHGAVIRAIGDPEQLSAVESGGILRTLARDTRAPTLRRLVRFSDPDEAAATLHVRAGNVKKAWEFYDTHDRVSHGMSHELRDAVLAAHLDDTARGITSIMVAGTLTNVAALNTATQAHHAATGRIDTTGPRIRLSDNHTGYPGDIIVTRRNNPTLRITGGHRNGTSIDNGDLWRIHHIHPDHSLTATGTTHRGTIHLPADYIHDHVELGYATTIHRAEGTTVDHAHTLLDDTLGRALAYVALTRGRHLNRLYLATDTLIDPTGDHQPDDPTQPQKMFARVLAREDDNLSATDTIRTEQTATDHRLHTAYTEGYQQLADAHGTYLLDRALPTVLFHAARRSEKFQELLDTIALADAHGLDTGELVGTIATNNHQDLGQSLTTARDTAAVLRARADHWITKHVHTEQPNHHTAPAPDPESLESPTKSSALQDLPYDQPLRPLPPNHPGSDTTLRTYLEELQHRLRPTTPSIPTSKIQPTHRNRRHLRRAAPAPRRRM
ncbi:MobF family relaxase [Nocardia sp. NPDC004068]|uniref:MobF family relaxase n=1 Tax=Nocardia sp. NPDC004068 TaxID=3364303 RepID=UPI0036B31C54